MGFVLGRRRGVRAVGAALAAAGLLASCGVSASTVQAGAYEGAAGAARLEQAAAATNAVKTMRMSIEMKIEGGPLSTTMSGEGKFDVANRSGHLVMDMGDLGLGALGDGTMETIVAGDAAYIKVPGAARLTGGKPWAKIDVEAANGLTGAGAGPSTGDATDPTSYMKILEEIGGDVSTVGEEEVRGVNTTHVVAEIDLQSVMDKATEAAGDELDEQMRDIVEDMGPLMEDMVDLAPVHVWVDDDGRVRKLEMHMSIEGFGAAVDGIEMVQTVEVYDFDKPVEITLPPADQVGELDLSALGGD